MATFKIEHFGPRTAERLAQGESGFIADRNIYLDVDGNVVEEDNPAQVRQLVGKGGTLSPSDVEKYGLGKKKRQSDTSAVEEVDGGEKASSPSANKAAVPSKNKAVKKGAKRK